MISVKFDLRTALARARAGLAALAPLTPLKSDDALVALIDAIIADAALFSFVERKVAARQDGTLSIEGAPPVALQAALELRGITWQQVLTYLPVLIEFLIAVSQ